MVKHVHFKNGILIIFLIIINLSMAIYSTPITNLGDAGAYFRLSKVFLGEVDGANLSNRSPLYSIIMAGFMMVFEEPLVFNMIIIFQYILVAISSYIVYLMFLRLSRNKIISVVITLAFNLSFSTIYYANILLTEILTVFLLISSLHFLFKIYDQCQWQDVLFLGTIIGLLSLARFNAVPLIVTFFILFIYVLYNKKVSLKRWAYFLFLFFIPYAILINAWSFYNYQNNGFYGLFARSGTITSRNTIVASINSQNVVSEENKSILDIFLKARDKYLAKKEPNLKGSLKDLDKFGILSDLYSGYSIYSLAKPELEAYFDLSAESGEHELSPKLGDFYKEIANQNSKFIWKMRFYSLLNSFRSSSNSLSLKYGNINLNILPSFAFKFYKVSYFMMSVFVFLAFFVFLYKVIKNNFKFDFTLLTMFFIIFSFWGINFLFVTGSDANRFKFPAEPLIIGLFLYYIYEGIKNVITNLSTGEKDRQLLT